MTSEELSQLLGKSIPWRNKNEVNTNVFSIFIRANLKLPRRNYTTGIKYNKRKQIWIHHFDREQGLANFLAQEKDNILQD